MAYVPGVLERMKGCVLIPSFNESKTIFDLISRIKDYGLDVIVIDDGSTDSTRELASRAGAEVICHPKNHGKGAALQTGFNRVISRDYDFIITMDGDGQHHPEDIAKFLQYYAFGTSDILIGNRMDFPETMPYVRWLTNRFMSMLISSLCKQYIPDSQCGFRLMKKKVLEDIALSTSNYEIESEFLIQASKSNYRIASIPIQTIYTGQVSQIHPVIDTLRFFRFIIRNRVNKTLAILRKSFKRKMEKTKEARL